MKKLLFFPTRYFPAISGAEFYIQRIAEIFKSIYGYEVDVITSNALDFRALRDPKGKVIDISNKYYSSVNKLKINRFSINYSLSLEEKLKKLNQIKEFKSLNFDEVIIKQFLRNGPFLDKLLENVINTQFSGYELIHTTFYPYFNLVLSLLIGQMLSIPTVCTPFFHFSNPRYLDSNMIRVLEKFDMIISCTKLEKEFLIQNFKIPQEKIQVIPMGVDFNIFSNKRPKKSDEYLFKENFFKNREKNYKMVLFCGYKNYEKGAISILKAIPQIVKKYRKVYFVFIGPSNLAFNRELSKIQKFSKARIINLTPENLTGYFDKKKIAAFKETDLYLMPSRSDAFGISYLEAWASGKPVIGANIGATPDVIKEYDDGLLVEFDNPIDISNKVLELLRNKKLRNNLGNSGKKKVERFYTWDIIVKKTNDVYQNLSHNG